MQTEAIAVRLAAIYSHPKYFLKYCTFTKDGNDLQHPVKAFPYHLEYHQEICDKWHSSTKFIIEKSRQMQITWTMLAMHLWFGLTGTDREIYFRRQTFEDALKLLEDMEFIYDHIPTAIWPRDLLPEKKTREGILSFPELNTTFFAVSSGRDKMRGRTPTAVLLDEFAFQDDDEFVYQTLKPSFNGGAKITIVSTPKPLFGAEDPYFRRIIQDRA
jgi:phage FluMu gp28-like protein